MDWDEAGRHFLPIPWCSFDGLLVKVLYDPAGRLSLMATDLESVYFESLKPRQVNRRIEDALAGLAEGAEGQSQSQGVMMGVGEDGERLLKDSVEAVIAAVSDGTAQVAISHAGFEHIVTIAIPGSFTLTFLPTSLEHQSSSALATHLVTPLLGVCSSLLSVLRDASSDDTALLRRIETAIDGSGMAERMDEGRAAQRFMGIGGPALLGRWVQKSQGAKEKDLQPVTLSLPSRPTRPSPFSPSSASRSPTKRRRSSTPPPHAPPAPAPSIASRMLDHRTARGAGERIGWEDSQPSRSSGDPGASVRTGDAEESQSQALTERQLSPPPVAQREGDIEVEEGEPTTDEEMAPVGAASGSPALAPSPTPPNPAVSPSPTPAAGTSAGPSRSERKRLAAEADLEEELARRRTRLEMLAATTAAAGAGAAGTKKKRKKL